MTSGEPAMANRRAFTLVELLVVVAIIAMLIAVLLPALNKAKDAAISVDCLSRQRQLAVGCLMYSSEHNNTVTATSRAGGTWHHWITYISGKKLITPNGSTTGQVYVSPGKTYGCPAFESYESDVKRNIYGNNPRYGYGMYSPRKQDHKTARGWDFYKYLKTKTPSGTTVDWYWLKMTRAPSPSGIGWLADASTYVKTWGWPWSMTAALPSGNWNPDQGDSGLGGGTIDWGARIRLVHNETANVVFMDGHGANHSDKELYETPHKIKNFRDATGAGYTYQP